ncbi:hypothetical protein [Mesorhizobium sp. Mes31]|uniref:hypothetical protein n=1 Tax=Mesorhizobium sp. Mes31 TaxID=2926017 RepID=UPI002118A321|nr:hypothetical protein [Mesorhizobium sp. Mes31]
MYDLAKNEAVLAVTEMDTGVAERDSPAIQSDADISLDRNKIVKTFEKADLLTFASGKSHRMSYGDSWVVGSFYVSGGSRYAKLHFYGKKKGSTKEGDLFRVTIVNGVVTEERIKKA